MAYHEGGYSEYSTSLWSFRSQVSNAALCYRLRLTVLDDEKYLLERDSKKQADIMKTHKLKKPIDLLRHYKRMGQDNIKDIIACGFLPEKTYIFSDLSSMG